MRFIRQDARRPTLPIFFDIEDPCQRCVRGSRIQSAAVIHDHQWFVTNVPTMSLFPVHLITTIAHTYLHQRNLASITHLQINKLHFFSLSSAVDTFILWNKHFNNLNVAEHYLHTFKIYDKRRERKTKH